MYGLYKETAAFDHGFNIRGIRQVTYLTSATFKNTETDDDYTVGLTGSTTLLEPQPFSFVSIPPGHYELTDWKIGEFPSSYNAAKCGKIAFDITSHDLLVFKSLRPLTFKGQYNILLSTRTIDMAEFAGLPPDAEDYIKANYKGALVDHTLKVVDLASDNPQAFQQCVAAHDAASATISIDPNAAAAPIGNLSDRYK
ncbi:MAG: hypothetical protein PW788_06885 [Micavibrio sp.]|nr:hypothetical protein [Micavibrio sp.]